MAEFTVSLWGSRPPENDDCWTGGDFDSQERAGQVFDNPWDFFDKSYFCSSTQYLVLEGPGIHKEKKNPEYREEHDNGEDDWKREIAMEAGMLHGCDGYNEVMGY